MAEGKKSFILYTDYIHTFNKLPDETAGKLIKHILAYVDDQYPETDDMIIEIAFEPIKQQLKRDLRRWEETSKSRSETGRLGGKKSGEARRNKAKQNEANEAIGLKTKQTKQNEHDTVTVNDNVNVNDNINIGKFNFKNALLNTGAKKQYVDEWLFVRKKLKAVNTETAFNKFINQVKKSGYTINEVLERCIEKNWRGFEAEWYKKEGIQYEDVDKDNELIEKLNL